MRILRHSRRLLSYTHFIAGGVLPVGKESGRASPSLVPAFYYSASVSSFSAVVCFTVV